LPGDAVQRLLIDNALDTYPRLRAEAVVRDNVPTNQEAVR
jgi:hypothetical protein